MEFIKLIEQYEQAWKPTTKELETVNMGDDQVKKEVKIRALINPEKRAEMIALFQEYTNVFSWSYDDIHDLDAYIIVHRYHL